jgi:hypothetical protein
MTWLDAGNIASVTTAITALIALRLAYFQITSSNKIAREASATELYNNCLMLALQYPKLANTRHYQINDEEVLDYRWFVAAILLSSERILEVTEGDHGWRNSVKSNLRRHSAYLAERQTDPQTDLPKFYSQCLIDVVSEVIAERDQSHGSYL